MTIKKQSLQIGKALGIPILIHWSFSLFVLFILYTTWANDLPLWDGFWFVFFVFVLFLFVILHELGHATAARRFGIDTQDIIISPIGGIARLEAIPAVPRQELIVALAGPAVNVGLAVICSVILLMFSSIALPETSQVNFVDAPWDYIRWLLLMNIALVIFNMIPAFPMDGGRVLRALLSYKYDRVKATYIAVMIARVFAVVFFAVGLYFSHFVLMFIAGFVLFTSGGEYNNVLMEKIYKNNKAIDAIISNPIFFSESDLLATVVEQATGKQANFLVRDDNGIVSGVVAQPLMTYAHKNNLLNEPLSKYMTSHYGSVQEDLSLNRLFDVMDRNGWYVVSVLSNETGQSLGIIDRTSLKQFVQTRKNE